MSAAQDWRTCAGLRKNGAQATGNVNVRGGFFDTWRSPMRSDQDIRRDVELELDWDPEIDARDIAVTAKSGVVTLTGFTKSYAHKYQAERDAKRVYGVVAVANDIEVRLPAIDQRPDPDIARDAVARLRNELPLFADDIKILVKHGWLTLEGAVEWNFQRDRAEAAVRRVNGIKGVSNMIVVNPLVTPSDLKREIEDAFKRNAELDANNIQVEVSDGVVTLKGKVRSLAERQEAQRVAWWAPGVTRVDNRLVVSPELVAA
jgi:osmotically-inducible protein OsmY